ncbi:hypothetical protein HDU98_007089 [Podochytrium sp. JEL0797]|nr:hypothetical protein HDU98_007089 [Podochytrium sp. JEL0797]
MNDQRHPLAYSSEAECGPSLSSESDAAALAVETDLNEFGHHRGTDDPLDFAADGNSGMCLAEMEADIDLKILTHVSGEDLEQRQNKFRKTVAAVHNIVSKKLYKEKSISLEIYFKEVWNISRAQVYRFLDCRVVLAHLDGFSRIPTRERLCRTLKTLAKTKHDLRILWAASLAHFGGNADEITSALLNQLWSELLVENKVSGYSEGHDSIPEGYTFESWDQHVESVVAHYEATWPFYVDARNRKSAVPRPTEPVWIKFADKKSNPPVFSNVNSFLESSDAEDHQAFTNPELNCITRALSLVDQRKRHLDANADPPTSGGSFNDNECSPEKHIPLTTPPPPSPFSVPTSASKSTTFSTPSSTTKSTKPRQKSSRSKSTKRSVSYSDTYDATDFLDVTPPPPPQPYLPIAAEPPRHASTQIKLPPLRIRPPPPHNLSDAELNNPSDTELDKSSDYLLDDLAPPLPATTARFRPSLSCASRVVKRPRKSEVLPILGKTQSPVDDTSESMIADDTVEDSCWSDFGPEELQAVAFLQEYRSGKRAVEGGFGIQVGRSATNALDENVIWEAFP